MFPLFNSLLHSLPLSELKLMPTLWYFAKGSWVRPNCHLVLVNNDMFIRIYFKHIALHALHRAQGCCMIRYMFTTVSPKTLLALILYRISYSQLNYYLARKCPPMSFCRLLVFVCTCQGQHITDSPDLEISMWSWAIPSTIKASLFLLFSWQAYWQSVQETGTISTIFHRWYRIKSRTKNIHPHTQFKLCNISLLDKRYLNHSLWWDKFGKRTTYL